MIRRLAWPCLLVSTLTAHLQGTVLAEEAPEPVLSEAVAPRGLVQVRVLEAGTREALADVELAVQGEDEPVFTDAEGRAQLKRLPGATTLLLALPGYEPKKVPIIIQEEVALDLTVYLTPRAGKSYAMTIETQRDDRDVTRYELDGAEARQAPGSLGDPVKTVQNLPGATRSPYGLGVLVIRGTSPNESGYLVNGTPVPLLFHFLGLTSALTPELVDRIDYLPGGFGVRTGRVIGGVVDVSMPRDFSRGTHGHVDLDLIDGGFHVQAPLTSQLEVALGGKISYLETLYGPLVNALLPYPLRASRYADLQTRLNVRLNERSSLHLTGLVSMDRFLLLGSEPAEGAVDLDVLAEYRSDFWRAQAELYQRFVGGLEHSLTLGAGRDAEYLTYYGTELESSPLPFNLRDEWTGTPHPALLLRAGLDLEVKRYQFRLELPGASADMPELQEGTGVSPSPYLEAVYSPPQGRLKGLQLQPGVRMDPLWVPSQGYSAVSLDPRLTVRYTQKTHFGKMEVNLAIGQYSQFPDPTEFFATYGNSALRPYHALQSSLGLRMQHVSGWKAELSGYFSHLRELVYLPEVEAIAIEDYLTGTVSVPEQPRPQNGARGRSYGLELLVRLPQDTLTTGWLSLSLGRSERNVSASPAPDLWYPFDYDQTFLLSWVGSRTLPRAWSVGWRFRYGTGLPYTGVTGRLQNLDTAGFTPLYDPGVGPNWKRLPPVHALDVRLERIVRFNQWILTGTLEVQNLYNHMNVELVYASTDYSQELPVYGLPVLPVLGIKGAW